MQILANNAGSKLAAAIAASATSLSVTVGASFPVVAAPDFALGTLDDGAGNVEIVKITAHAAGAAAFAVVRAQEGTTAQAFAAGVAFEMRVTAATAAALQVLAGAGTPASILAALGMPVVQTVAALPGATDPGTIYVVTGS